MVTKLCEAAGSARQAMADDPAANTPGATASPRPEPDWTAVKHDYLHSSMTVREVAAHHQITPSLLFARRAFEGWRKRSQQSRPGLRRVWGVAAPTPPLKQAIATRLMKVIETQLKQMEADMAEDNGAARTPADNERRARAVGNLTRSLEQATELCAHDRNTHAAGVAPERAEARDALQLRRELAERLAKLSASLRG